MISSFILLIFEIYTYLYLVYTDQLFLHLEIRSIFRMNGILSWLVITIIDPTLILHFCKPLMEVAKTSLQTIYLFFLLCVITNVECPQDKYYTSIGVQICKEYNHQGQMIKFCNLNLLFNACMPENDKNWLNLNYITNML